MVMKQSLIHALKHGIIQPKPKKILTLLKENSKKIFDN